jgi:CRP/FNR family transcriptional regulator, cyclic AMP receptor protein
MTADVAGILRGTALLGSAPAEDLSAVAAASRLRNFRRGQVVFSRGDPGDTVIVVVSGRVKVVLRSADGGELTLTVIQAGGLFGELSVADNGPRSTDAETLEDCQLLFISRERVQDLCARVPSVAQALTSSIAATLRRLTGEAGDLVFLDLPRRVALTAHLSAGRLTRTGLLAIVGHVGRNPNRKAIQCATRTQPHRRQRDRRHRGPPARRRYRRPQRGR